MKLQRTKNACRNVVFGMALRLYQIVVPFMMRTAMLYWMGLPWLGLSSLFTSVLSILNLAELGVGAAMVFSMYRPIAQDDTQTVCALLRLYRTYYRIIGVAVAVLGLACMPLLPRLISGTIPDGVNLYILYLLYLASTVSSYFLFSYRGSLLIAFQRTDLISKTTIAVSAAQYAGQLLVLFLLRNYYAYLVLAIVGQVLTNLLTAFVAKRRYPQYVPQGRLAGGAVRALNSRIRDLFTSKIGGVVVNSADSIVISAFLGLSVLAVYQNYYMVLTAVIGLVSILLQSCLAGIGNSLIVETAEKNYADLQVFTLMIAWVSGVCTCCLLGFYQPFMQLWTRGQGILGFGAVVCFAIYFYVFSINQLLNLYKDAAGIWHKDRFRPLVTALANLALNLVLVQKMGLFGVLFSTVVTMLAVGMPWLLQNLFTTVFDRKPWAYVGQLVGYSVIVLLSGAITVVCSWATEGRGDAGLVLRVGVCAVTPNFLFWLFCREKATYQRMRTLVKRVFADQGGRKRWHIGNKEL